MKRKKRPTTSPAPPGAPIPGTPGRGEYPGSDVAATQGQSIVLEGSSAGLSHGVKEAPPPIVVGPMAAVRARLRFASRLGIHASLGAGERLTSPGSSSPRRAPISPATADMARTQVASEEGSHWKYGTFQLRPRDYKSQARTSRRDLDGGAAPHE
jgi:hypothetical protein